MPTTELPADELPTDGLPADGGLPRPPHPPGPDPSVLPAELRSWVAGAAANAWTADQARAWLVGAGWSAPAVEAAMADFAAQARTVPFTPRPPRPARTHKHSLAYSVLLWSLGLSVLALGSSLHLVLEAAFRSEQASWVLANWLTLFVCTIPFVAVAHHQVLQIERDDPLARYSSTRDALSLTLLWAAALVGIARLLLFVHQTITSLVVERDASDLVPNLAHVSVVVLLAGGVYLWTWQFRHPAARPDAASSAPASADSGGSRD